MTNVPKSAFALVALTLACQAADVPGTSDPVGLDPQFAASGGVHVLNTQLRGVIDSGIEPSSAYGHVQVKLTEQADGQFQVDWKGKIFNPGGELIVGGSMGIINPDIEPFFEFFSRGDALFCDVIVFDSQGIINPDIIPAEVANGMIIDPGIHEARFERLFGGDVITAVQGTFGPSSPEATVSAPSQTGGPSVRCDI